MRYAHRLYEFYMLLQVQHIIEAYQSSFKKGAEVLRKLEQVSVHTTFYVYTTHTILCMCMLHVGTATRAQERYGGIER